MSTSTIIPPSVAFKVDSSIALSKYGKVSYGTCGRPPLYPYRYLKRGESFFVSQDKAQAALNAGYVYVNVNGGRFQYRRGAESGILGVRIWATDSTTKVPYGKGGIIGGRGAGTTPSAVAPITTARVVGRRLPWVPGSVGPSFPAGLLGTLRPLLAKVGTTVTISGPLVERTRMKHLWAYERIQGIKLRSVASEPGAPRSVTLTRTG